MTDMFSLLSIKISRLSPKAVHELIESIIQLINTINIKSKYYRWVYWALDCWRTDCEVEESI